MLKPTPKVKQPDAPSVNEVTLRSLFESEESPLLRYAFSLVGRRAVAEEIVQDVFLQLHADWQTVVSPRAWLWRSVRNKAFNYIRDNKREILDSDDCTLKTSTSKHETPEDQLLRMEATGTLRSMVEELDQSDQQLVRLKYFENLSYREISDQTSLSVSNVGYRLHHVLKELARKLRPFGIDGKS